MFYFETCNIKINIWELYQKFASSIELKKKNIQRIIIVLAIPYEFIYFNNISWDFTNYTVVYISAE